MEKTALITGASRGIGKAIAAAFAKAGYSLSLCCQNSGDILNTFAEQLKNDCHVRVLTFSGDVGDAPFVQEMLTRTMDTFGHLDVLINNAGISYIGLLTDMDLADWNRIVSVNLNSVFLTCRHAVPSMVSAKSGRIINISSVWGCMGASCEVAYSACKGAVNAFTKALGKELAPSNICVNAIACGVIDTDMNHCFSREELDSLTEEIPAGRMGTPEEVAQLALSLASSPSYLNGQVITLDGGWI